MRAEDAIFNWLQIQLVVEARPEDQAARDTCSFFKQILEEDYHIFDISVQLAGEDRIEIAYVTDGQAKKQLFPRESAEQLLHDINSNPKYN